MTVFMRRFSLLPSPIPSTSGVCRWASLDLPGRKPRGELGLGFFLLDFVVHLLTTNNITRDEVGLEVHARPRPQPPQRRDLQRVRDQVDLENAALHPIDGEATPS